MGSFSSPSGTAVRGNFGDTYDKFTKTGGGGSNVSPSLRARE